LAVLSLDEVTMIGKERPWKEGAAEIVVCSGEVEIRETSLHADASDHRTANSVVGNQQSIEATCCIPVFFHLVT